MGMISSMVGRVSQTRSNTASLPTERTLAARAVALGVPVLRALAAAHGAGLVHRDVKPENVLLSPSGKPGSAFPWTAKLVDLGLARPSAKEEGGEMNLTMQGMLMGTPATMAPEQFDDPDHVDYRADIYGLGCVLFHALTGSPAFNSRTLGEIVSSKVSGTIPNPAVLRDTIPREVCDLVTKMLARDRGMRPQSYVDVNILAPLGEQVSVPFDAVLDTGTTAWVFLTDGKGQFDPTSVTIRAYAGDRVAIASGLKGGEQIVVGANFLIDSESRLKAGSEEEPSSEKGVRKMPSCAENEFWDTSMNMCMPKVGK